MSVTTGKDRPDMNHRRRLIQSLGSSVQSKRTPCKCLSSPAIKPVTCAGLQGRDATGQPWASLLRRRRRSSSNHAYSFGAGGQKPWPAIRFSQPGFSPYLQGGTKNMECFGL